MSNDRHCESAGSAIARRQVAVRPFSTGEEGEADFSWVFEAGGMAAPLAGQDYLARAFLSNGVLTWPNGFDVDSINLHREMRESRRLCRIAA